MRDNTESINQLKYKLEDFEHTNKVFETGFIKGLFYAFTLLEDGRDEAEAKLSSDKIRSTSAEVEQALDQLEDALQYAGNIDRDKGLALIAKIRKNLYT